MSLSNHKHTVTSLNGNCKYRVGGDNDDDSTKPLVFPGNMAVEPKQQVLLDEIIDHSAVLQNLCVEAFDSGKGNLVEDALKSLKMVANDIKKGIVEGNKKMH